MLIQVDRYNSSASLLININRIVKIEPGEHGTCWVTYPGDWPPYGALWVAETYESLRDRIFRMQETTDGR